MKIKYDNVVLRDYLLSDVEDEVRWTTVEAVNFIIPYEKIIGICQINKI